MPARTALGRVVTNPNAALATWFGAFPDLRYLKYKVADLDQVLAWRHVSFFAPHTGQRVQGWFADDGSENGGDTYQGVTCLACNQLHMVNPRTGKVLGADEETN